MRDDLRKPFGTNINPNPRRTLARRGAAASAARTSFFLKKSQKETHIFLHGLKDYPIRHTDFRK